MSELLFGLALLCAALVASGPAFCESPEATSVRDLPACQTDALGNTTYYAYDRMGRRTRIIDALGQMTAFEYDARGNLTKEIGPVGDRNGDGFRGRQVSGRKSTYSA